MNHPLIRAFIDTGPVGQAIMLILLILSITAWSIIIEKIFFFRKLKRSASLFLDSFHNTVHSSTRSGSLDRLDNDSLLYKLYHAGVHELKQITGAMNNTPQPLTKSQQNDLELFLKREVSRNAQDLDRNMIILATSANVSPLLGLLGTVYGLLVAFHEMGIMGSASIEVVSPGISQALITTVIGLFVAIPSAVGYNYLLNSIKNLITDMENFSSEFLSYAEKGRV